MLIQEVGQTLKAYKNKDEIVNEYKATLTGSVEKEQKAFIEELKAVNEESPLIALYMEECKQMR